MANSIHATMQKNSSTSVEAKANFSINASKIEEFISHTLRALFIQWKGSFDHVSGTSEDVLR